MGIFKKRWSNWKDMSVGLFSDKPYVLQARRSINGKVEFRVSTTTRHAYNCKAPTLEELENLEK